MEKNKYDTNTLIEASKNCHKSEFDNLTYEKTKNNFLKKYKKTTWK
jgi:hypothetical protein